MDLSYPLAVVRLFVRDWERAVRFYTDVLGMRDPEGNVLTLLGQAPAAAEAAS